jgi:outer membrane receptor protein involved in Fe transport
MRNVQQPFQFAAIVLCCCLLGPFASLAEAQATTGSINGTIKDDTGGALPGVTVTITAPTLMGTQTAVTSDEGHYRFPSIPPGLYRVTYELQGFETVVHTAIQVNIGFTATLNVTLKVAGLEETVTVQGGSPVVDVQNANVQANFSAEMLRSLPTARDLWAVYSLTPGMRMGDHDVGGSRAGTQSGFSAYGASGQTRLQVDGVNMNEGTGGGGYMDFGSLEEVQIGTSGNDASVPTPGVVVNALTKSGGNVFKNEVYFDYENASLQGTNVTDSLRRLGAGEGTRIKKYRDINLQSGGPIQRDKLWYFGSFRSQVVGTTVTGFPVEDPSDIEFPTTFPYAVGKLTYQINPNNKISHYLQLRRKLQPLRGASGSNYLDSVFYQESNASQGNVEWNRVVTPTFFFTGRVSSWGYNWLDYPYGEGGTRNTNLKHRRTDNNSGNTAGAANAGHLNRRRWQFDWGGTLFRDNWAGGDHSIKVGWGSEREIARTTRDRFLDSFVMTFNSPAGAPDFTTPFRVTLYNSPERSQNNNWHHGAYVQDQINLSPKLTLNAGIRWDFYDVYYPEQEIREGPFREFFYAGAPLPNGYSIPASYPDFRVPAMKKIIRYNASWGPRLGLSWDVAGDAKTVAKGSWGRYYYNPGSRGDVNPVQLTTYTFNWIDSNQDRSFTINELGSFVSSSGGVRNTIDPNLGQPYTDDMSLWLERQIMPQVSGRVGFVYKRLEDLYQNVELARVSSLYTAIIQGYDPGPDGIRGNQDDVGALTLFDIPAGVTVPASQTQLQTPEEYDENFKSIDVTLNKRMSNRWSLVTGFLYTWKHQLLFGRPSNPNQERYNAYDTSEWSFKLFGTVQAPWGFVVSPLLRYQSGDEMRRIVQVTGLRAGTFDYTAEPYGTYRGDSVPIFDVRTERRFEFGSQRELGLFIDAFNLTNSNPATARDSITGRRTVELAGERIEYARFYRPTSILGPRIFRIGVKLLF